MAASVLSKDMENLYRNLSDGGKEYTIKKGRNNSETKKIDPRCLVSWYRSNMTAATLATGQDGLRNDFVGCLRGAQSPDISMDPLKYSLTRTVKDGASKDLPDDHWFNYSRPTVWFGYAESLFLKAEAALRGWTGADLTLDAEGYFRAGVKASMDYYHIADADAQAYIDGLKVWDEGVFSSGDREAILEAIITQKWMAVFPNGNEVGLTSVAPTIPPFSTCRPTSLEATFLTENRSSACFIRTASRRTSTSSSILTCRPTTLRAHASGGMWLTPTMLPATA